MIKNKLAISHSQNYRRGPDYENNKQKHQAEPSTYPPPLMTDPHSQSPGWDYKQIAQQEINNNNILKTQMANLEERCRQQQLRINAMQAARDAQEDILGNQEPDINIKQRFNVVFSSIKTWCNKFPQDASRPLDGRSSVTEIWIPKELRGSVATLEGSFYGAGEVSPVAFQEWRALTLSLLCKAFPSYEWTKDAYHDLKQILEVVFMVLRPLASPTANQEELASLLLEGVFIEAIKLSQMMRRQRAYWYLSFPETEQRSDSQLVFRGEEMAEDGHDDGEDDEGQREDYERDIDMVILPGLHKKGNHDGLHYDVEHVAIKAEVLCKPRIK
ncbi:hypothetical protein FACUT_11542 [Fusarium acutatum]|uniref:Uncharacterized protein n=1 Tax=Fusarium acutatum TaxID=78861 RepID=A0A8H4JFL3_9HYPO|nr:hypothetical protein FACUT_11542 [Fusarium acutatum]